MASLDWHPFFFTLFALVACVFGLAVLFTSNVVRMAFYLVISLGATAGLFFLAGAEFVGAMQLMIYVGGTLVLLIFGVMLTARDSFISMKTGGGEWVLAVIVGGSMLLLLLFAAFQVESWSTPRENYDSVVIADSKSATPIGLAVTGGRIDKNEQANPELRKGMSGYLLPFEIVSMHLLVVLIGASYLARTKRRSTGPALPQAARGPRNRPAAITGMLLGGAVANAVLGLLCLLFSGRIVAFVAGFGESLETNAVFLTGLLFLVNVVVLMAIYAWQRWGLYALVLIAVAQAALLAVGGLSVLAAAIFLAAALVPVAITLVAICSGGPQSVCSQMDSLATHN
ncbi:NADH-quinone oxidoreductase subunit J family protein [Lignipirellula cremea]|nr:NADH-quinone oxidoreductase subunit J [Lignipirellula cremea]